MAQSGHSRHCNNLSAIGQERTLTINTPDRISEGLPRGGLSVCADGQPWPYAAPRRRLPIDFRASLTILWITGGREPRRRPILRKVIIAVAAIIAIGAAAVSTDASAYWRGGWHGGYGGWHGGWGYYGGGFAAGAILGGLLAAPYYYGGGPLLLSGPWLLLRTS
jgi:hypothetical protein